MLGTNASGQRLWLISMLFGSLALIGFANMDIGSASFDELHTGSASQAQREVAQSDRDTASKSMRELRKARQFASPNLTGRVDYKAGHVRIFPQMDPNQPMVPLSIPASSSDSITYTYDSLNRLAIATYASGGSITFSYDAAGNRTAHQVNGTGVMVNTAAGTNVIVQGNGVTASFATITSDGVTSIAPFNPGSVSGLPNGYQLFGDSAAFNISTNAVGQGSIGVCFNGYFNLDFLTFSRLRLLHNENGFWVNRTATSDLASRNICSNVSSVGQFAIVLLGPPTALLDEVSGRAAALDSVTFVRDPIPVIDPTNFSIDGRARLSFFVMSVDLLPSESTSLVTAEAEDAQHVVYPLKVESVANVPKMDWLTQVIVKLPDILIGKGDIQLSVTVRAIKSEKVTVRIQ